MTARWANRHRGEVEAELDGRRHVLCLTLGALAELETAFGADDLAMLGRRLAEGRLSARDIVRILGAGLRGGGSTLSDDEVASLPVAGNLDTYARCVANLLAAAFGAAKPQPVEATANP
ncbi:gene transfer agent family protein [Chelatococcus asaccharovorans]|uniref:gene transfer agent family protein n=1 Tax=Chelatococcus asaccharovorans TaxID=28210 RepID=UPI00224C70D2|nr:gene transfer agent family protein [Chelatococcus asaccharovorans]CAH1671154.1 Tail tube GTA-gp10-like protein [Chelatococcus asaccharovorans]CAH1677401.1 Tail tube GTA-gp10-like protein [Chelatococcus asaccharovorans]